MDKILKQSLLYDFYGELLNEHQRSVYEDYVLNDLSLGEIAQDMDISRQGVYDILKRCDKKLESYEAKLHLIEKFLKTKEKVQEINAYANQILEQTEDMDKTITCVKKIEMISNGIITDM